MLNAVAGMTHGWNGHGQHASPSQGLCKHPEIIEHTQALESEHGSQAFLTTPAVEVATAILPADPQGAPGNLDRGKAANFIDPLHPAVIVTDFQPLGAPAWIEIRVGPPSDIRLPTVTSRKQYPLEITTKQVGHEGHRGSVTLQAPTAVGVEQASTQVGIDPDHPLVECSAHFQDPLMRLGCQVPAPGGDIESMNEDQIGDLRLVLNQ